MEPEATLPDGSHAGVYYNGSQIILRHNGRLDARSVTISGDVVTTSSTNTRGGYSASVTDPALARQLRGLEHRWMHNNRIDEHEARQIADTIEVTMARVRDRGRNQRF